MTVTTIPVDQLQTGDTVANPTISREVYATWRNYAGQTVVEYNDYTITLDGIIAPANSAPIWSDPIWSEMISAAVDVAREVPLWAVLDSAGTTDSDACLRTCITCADVWPAESLDEDSTCPLCLAAEHAATLAALKNNTRGEITGDLIDAYQDLTANGIASDTRLIVDRAKAGAR